MANAGRSIRNLAFSRRARAFLLYVLGGLIVSSILYLNVAAHLAIPLWTSLFCLPLFFSGYGYWQKANRADQGAVAEEQVGQILSRLPRSWQVQYNLRDRSVGDIDAVVVAPDGRAWAIDTKSHAGQVLVDSGGLYRRLGEKTLRFEGNFLFKSKKQARVARERLGVRWVTPVICFTRANIGVKNPLVDGVHLVEASQLLRFLTGRGVPS